MVRKSHVVYYPASFSQLSFLLSFLVFSQYGPILGSCILLLTNMPGIYKNNKFLSYLQFEHSVSVCLSAEGSKNLHYKDVMVNILTKRNYCTLLVPSIQYGKTIRLIMKLQVTFGLKFLQCSDQHRVIEPVLSTMAQSGHGAEQHVTKTMKLL